MSAVRVHRVRDVRAAVGDDGQAAARRGRARWGQSRRSQIRQPRQADRRRGPVVVEGDALGVGQLVRVAQFAAQGHRELRPRRPVPVAPLTTLRAIQKYRLPSGISGTWVRMRLGAENAW